jgi:hypothetical protein
MLKLTEFKKQLKQGAVYRRSELTAFSNAVDRHVQELVAEGTLKKLAPGLYYYPHVSVFGEVPPDEESLVRSFLKDDEFLITSPNDYNSLGIGTSQLYNKKIVYNHKRHGEFKLGGKLFFFHAKHRFPKIITTEYLLIDLINNIDTLAEDSDTILKNVSIKVKSMDNKKLLKAVNQYGSVKTKAFLKQILLKQNVNHDC